MGCGDSETTMSQWNDNTQTTQLMNAGPEEQRLRAAISSLGDEQQKAVLDAVNFARSGDFLQLSPQSQQSLNTAYDAALNQYNVQSKQYADYLAGGRGLRMSDSPIADQAIQQYGLGLANLQGERALAGLNLGLQSNSVRMNSLLNSSQALPAGQTFMNNTLFNERLAQPTTTFRGLGGSHGTNSPSLLTQFQQGAGAFKDVATGISSLYGGGGGSAASTIGGMYF